jgi:hypothetical protein
MSGVSSIIMDRKAVNGSSNYESYQNDGRKI